MTSSGPAAQKLFPLLGVLRPIQRFFQLEAAGGIVLLAMAAVALTWANWPGTTSYLDFVELPLAFGIGAFAVQTSLREVVNDGLMTVFFFVVGLEIKRELVRGELRTPSSAALPALAALGGMVIPAGIYLMFTRGGDGAVGWGIPMATDIAFTIGCLALVKSRVPHALVVFVTALAIFDDIGGILVIALFYGSGLHLGWLAAALGAVIVGVMFNRLDVRNAAAYFGVGVALWYGLHHAGIHATLAGVILGMIVPARAPRGPRELLEELAAHAGLLASTRPDDELASAEVSSIEQRLEQLQAPLDRLLHALHPFVAFAIMPAFALMNAGVAVSATGLAALASPVALGASLGLCLGKQLGIFVVTLGAVKLGLAAMPGGASLAKLYGVSVVAGIGFTVALFIATLAFPQAPVLLDQAKLGILVGSSIAGLLGLVVLVLTPPIRAARR